MINQVDPQKKDVQKQEFNEFFSSKPNTPGFGDEPCNNLQNYLPFFKQENANTDFAQYLYEQLA